MIQRELMRMSFHNGWQTVFMQSAHIWAWWFESLVWLWIAGFRLFDETRGSALWTLVVFFISWNFLLYHLFSVEFSKLTGMLNQHVSMKVFETSSSRPSRLLASSHDFSMTCHLAKGCSLVQELHQRMQELNQRMFQLYQRLQQKEGYGSPTPLTWRRFTGRHGGKGQHHLDIQLSNPSTVKAGWGWSWRTGFGHRKIPGCNWLLGNAHVSEGSWICGMSFYHILSKFWCWLLFIPMQQ